MQENFKIDDAYWVQLKDYLTCVEIPAKTILLSEGETSKKLFVIEKGCLRSWFNNNGKDITFQFFFEGQMVSSIESFITNQPSMFTIESIEHTVIYYMTKKDFLSIVDKMPYIKQQVDQFTFQRLIYYQRLFLSRIKDNPEKRYLELLETNPQILLRVPQHYIASYLGITSVSLSRIKAR